MTLKGRREHTKEPTHIHEMKTYRIEKNGRKPYYMHPISQINCSSQQQKAMPKRDSMGMLILKSIDVTCMNDSVTCINVRQVHKIQILNSINLI